MTKITKNKIFRGALVCCMCFVAAFSFMACGGNKQKVLIGVDESKVTKIVISAAADNYSKKASFTDESTISKIISTYGNYKLEKTDASSIWSSGVGEPIYTVRVDHGEESIYAYLRKTSSGYLFQRTFGNRQYYTCGISDSDFSYFNKLYKDN